jgi:carboxyl-terminal processing protease
MPLSLRVLLLIAAALAANDVRGQSSSPAMQAYGQLQSMRASADELVEAKGRGTDADLRAALAVLDRALARMDTPEIHDLAEGNAYLRYRRFDILCDKASLLERLGDRAGAVAALAQASLMGAMDVATTHPDLAPVIADPSAAAIRARYAASARLAQASAFKTVADAPLTDAQRLAGLSRIWSVARQNFAWFEHVPDLDWDRAYVDEIPKVTATRDTLAYYRELMRFMALLHDGHSNVYPSRSLAERLYARPGLDTARIEGAVVVTDVSDAAVAAAGVKPGDALLAIDGIPVAAYAARFVAPYQSASTSQDLELRTFAYGLLAGDSSKRVRLTLRDSRGRQRDVVAARSGWRRVHQTANESFEVRADGVAVLDASQFEDDAALKLLEQHRDELMHAKAFVLDLRRNGGGSSDFGLAILSTLSHEPLPAMAFRVRADNAFTLTRISSVLWQRLDSGDNGASPGSKFEGPVAVLIGPATFSAAEDTAATFKVMKRGLVVGLHSGGSTGQPALFDLPGGGHARICVKRDGYPDGSDFVGAGIQPDIVVPATLAAVREGRDPTLERAAEALLSQLH